MILLVLFITTLLPLAEKSIDIEIIDGEHVIAGTLHLPENERGESLAILLSGSGAQDRTSKVAGFEVFTEMANQLTDQGQAVFRFDDRGTGKSTGDSGEATIEDLANDVNVIMNYFMSSEEHSFSAFTLIGHSQGGMVATKVAVNSKVVEKIILVATPILPLEEVISEQTKSTQKLMGRSESDISASLKFQDMAYEAAKTNSGWSELEQSFTDLVKSQIAALPEAQQAMIPDVDGYAKQLFDQQVSPMKSNIMRSLLLYNITDDLSKIDIPITAIFGEKDLQVTAVKNVEVFERVCKSNNLICEMEVIDSANHLFQTAKIGVVQEYPSLPKAFTTSFIEVLTKAL